MAGKWVEGSVFVGAAHGLNVQFALADDGRVTASCRLRDAHQGPPGYAHGGVLASLLDEAMSAAAWLAGYSVVAVHLDFDYRRAVPIGAAIVIEGAVTGTEGDDARKVFTNGTILLEGVPAVSGSGIFVQAPQLFDRPGFRLREEDTH